MIAGGDSIIVTFDDQSTLQNGLIYSRETRFTRAVFRNAYSNAQKLIIFPRVSCEITASGSDCIPKLLEFQECDGNNVSAVAAPTATDRGLTNKIK